MAKLSDELVSEIVALRRDGKSFQQIAALKGIDRKTAAKGYAIWKAKQNPASGSAKNTNEGRQEADVAGTVVGSPTSAPLQSTEAAPAQRMVPLEEAKARVFAMLNRCRTLTSIVIETELDPEFVKNVWNEWTELQSLDWRNPSVPAQLWDLTEYIKAMDDSYEEIMGAFLREGFPAFFQWGRCAKCRVYYPMPKFLRRWECPNCAEPNEWTDHAVFYDSEGVLIVEDEDA